jgi:hypothetical protein
MSWMLCPGLKVVERVVSEVFATRAPNLGVSRWQLS